MQSVLRMLKPMQDQCWNLLLRWKNLRAHAVITTWLFLPVFLKHCLIGAEVMNSFGVCIAEPCSCMQLWELAGLGVKGMQTRLYLLISTPDCPFESLSVYLLFVGRLGII